MANLVYEDCRGCLAQPFCKMFNGVIPKKEKRHCGPKYFLYESLKSANIPLKFYNANTFHYNPLFPELDAAMCKIIDNIVSVIEEERKGFIFHSPTVGCGKTFCGCMLLNHYLYKVCQSDEFDIGKPLALYVDYADFIDTVRYEKKDVGELFSWMKSVKLLMLDDVGAGKMSDFAREQTNILINHRYNNQLSTIVTSNLSPQELSRETLLGKRATSRLSDNAYVVAFSNNSFRDGGKFLC